MEQGKLRRGRPRKIIGSIPDQDTTFQDKEPEAEVSDTSTKSDIPAKPTETSDAKGRNSNSNTTTSIRSESSRMPDTRRLEEN